MLDKWPLHARWDFKSVNIDTLLYLEVSACVKYVRNSLIKVPNIIRGVFTSSPSNISEVILSYYGTLFYQDLSKTTIKKAAVRR